MYLIVNMKFIDSVPSRLKFELKLKSIKNLIKRPHVLLIMKKMLIFTKYINKIVLINTQTLVNHLKLYSNFRVITKFRDVTECL